MKQWYIILLGLFIAACTQHQNENAAKPDVSRIQEGPILQADDATKQFLIDITNASWYSAKLAYVATLMSHDQNIIKSAQAIRKDYTRIKDKAKIVSIPYHVEVPYFLTTEQNDSVNMLQNLDSLSFDKKFISMIRNNNDNIIMRCDNFQKGIKRSDDLQQLIDFCRSTVAANPLSKP